MLNSKPGMEVAVPEGDSSTGPKKSRLSRDEPPLALERTRDGEREEKGYGQRERKQESRSWHMLRSGLVMKTT